MVAHRIVSVLGRPAIASQFTAPSPSFRDCSCPVRGVLSSAAGYVMGLVVGGMFAGMGMSSQLEPLAASTVDAAPQPMWRVVKEGLLDLKARSLSSAKSFAVVGGVYATVECFLENYRGKKGALDYGGGWGGVGGGVGGHGSGGVECHLRGSLEPPVRRPASAPQT